MVAIQALVEQGSQVAPSNIVHVQVMLLSYSTLHTAVVLCSVCHLYLVAAVRLCTLVMLHQDLMA